MRKLMLLLLLASPLAHSETGYQMCMRQCDSTVARCEQRCWAFKSWADEPQRPNNPVPYEVDQRCTERCGAAGNLSDVCARRCVIQ